MKRLLISAAVALACSAALAQAPANPAKAVEQEAVPLAPKTAAAAEAKVDARKAANPGADGTKVKQTPVTGEGPVGSKTAGDKAAMNLGKRDIKAMDANGDGMVSRKEYDDYHAKMWKRMKVGPGGVPESDAVMMLKQGLGGN